MGIKRLFNALKERFQTRQLDEFSGKKFGIDGMNWLYQAFYSLHEEPEKIHMPLIRKLESKFKLLQSHNIDFVVVIDGRRLEGKKLALEKRSDKREQYRETAANPVAGMELEDEEAHGKYAQHVTAKLIFFFIDYLQYRGYDYFVAPYEADAQLAYMYHERQIDYIAGEDSDFIAMSCFGLIRGIKREGTCLVMDTESPELPSAGQNWTRYKALSHERRVMLCIMNGCDYLDNLHGVGFASLIKFFHDHRALADAPFYEEMQRSLLQRHAAAAPGYIAQCRLILHSFTAQLVYDPVKGKMRNMGRCREGDPQVETYTGARFTSPANQKAFVAGELDFETLKPRPCEEFDFARAILFLGQTTRDYVGGLSNLCDRIFTYGNFMEGEVEAKTPVVEDEPPLRTSSVRAPSCARSERSQSQKRQLSCAPKRVERSCSQKPREALCSKVSVAGKSCDRTTRVSARDNSVSCYSREKRSIKRCKAN